MRFKKSVSAYLLLGLLVIALTSLCGCSGNKEAAQESKAEVEEVEDVEQKPESTSEEIKVEIEEKQDEEDAVEIVSEEISEEPSEETQEETSEDIKEEKKDVSIYDSCLLAHQIYGGEYKLSYSTELTYDIEHDGVKYTVQPDCSGCVNFGLELAGLIPSDVPCTMDHDNDLSKYGLTKIEASKLTLPDDLRKGDLIVYSDHIEMYVGRGEASGRDDIDDIKARPLVITYGDNWGGLAPYEGWNDVFACDPSVVSYYHYDDIKYIWRYE